MPDLSDIAFRKQIVDEINQEENHARKREHQKRFDVFRDKQDQYVLERLQREFDPKTVNAMRKIFSLNLTPRIIDEMSSIYNSVPERTFTRNDGREVSEAEALQLENLYSDLRVNQMNLKANKLFNLHDQCALMIVPDKMGSIKYRAIPPLHYDVIPMKDDPERAWAYVLNVWDEDTFGLHTNADSEPTQLHRFRENDRRNQAIADQNDRESKLKKYVVWTDELHFVMDNEGNFIGDVMENPIGRLPFVDIAKDKDFSFFVDRGSNVVDFALDIALMWSDLANNIRMQGYSQAVISSEKQPANYTVGPNHILWLEQDPNASVQPKFEFVSPNPDIMSALEYLITYIKMFLSSRGQDPKTISVSGQDSQNFSSGVERLLSMLEKFEATRSDIDLFEKVEVQAFEIVKLWSNALQGRIDEDGNAMLKDSLNISSISDDTFLDIQFSKPEDIQTKKQKEESVYAKMDRQLMSRKMALMELDGLSEEAAENVIKEIDAENSMDSMDDPIEEVNGEITEGN